MVPSSSKLDEPPSSDGQTPGRAAPCASWMRNEPPNIANRLVGAAGLAAALVCAACGPEKPAAIRTSSSPKQPAWLIKPPQAADALYFSGAKEGTDSLEAGKDAAMSVARDQAAQFIGVSITSEHSDTMSTDLAADQITDKVKSKAQAMIRSAALEDVYWEKISREAGSGTIDRFDVWVLLKLPKVELEKERQRQADEAKQTARSSLARLREGQAQEKAGNLLAALVRYRDVVTQTKPLDRNLDTGDAQVATSGQLRQVAEDAAAAVQARARRAVIVSPDWAAGPIIQALSAKGFTAQMGADEASARAAALSAGMPWVIVVKAQTTPGGKIGVQVAASTVLDVRIMDAISGAAVASTQKQAKEWGRTPEAAQQAAAGAAGMAAGNDVAAALVAKENAGL